MALVATMSSSKANQVWAWINKTPARLNTASMDSDLITQQHTCTELRTLLYLRDKTYLKHCLNQGTLAAVGRYLLYRAVRVMQPHILCTRDKQTSALTPPWWSRQKKSIPERSVIKRNGSSKCACSGLNGHDSENRLYIYTVNTIYLNGYFCCYFWIIWPNGFCYQLACLMYVVHNTLSAPPKYWSVCDPLPMLIFIFWSNFVCDVRIVLL